MNTAIRTLAAPFYFATPSFFSTKPRLTTWILTFAVMFSGFGVVYLSDTNRRMTTTIESASAHKNYLETEWDKLLLERSTWSSQSRVQQIALATYGMIAPNPRTVVTIRLET